MLSHEEAKGERYNVKCIVLSLVSYIVVTNSFVGFGIQDAVTLMKT